jgi:predicted acylesterase/phospholipase RssA/CRP-like cAMP-binding protein
VIELLQNVSIFEDASEALLQEADAALAPSFVGRGQVVCRKGEPGTGLYLIRAGQVRVSLPCSGGQEEILGYLGPGDCFGEMSLITGEPVSADVTATVPTELLILDGARFTQLCDKHPLLYRGISKTLSKRLRDTNLKRFVTRLGKVTRFVTPRPECDREIFLPQIVRLMETLRDLGQRRILLFLPITSDLLNSDAALNQWGFGQCDTERTPGKELSGVLTELKADYREHDSRWLSFGEGLDVLLWASPWGDSFWESEKTLNDILSRLKTQYSHLFVVQLGWPIEEFLRQLPPDDQIIFLIDLLAEDAQREAGREEYEHYVPEGDRYPPSNGDCHWMLSPTSVSEIQRLAGAIRLGFSDASAIRVAVIHRDDRPLLDYSWIRKMLPDCAVHVLPLGRSAESQEPDTKKDVSIALALGRRPAVARGRIVRDLAGLRIGLALGGGGARGLAHVGVIKVLEEEGIPIDMVAGASYGAVVAAAYAVGRNGPRLVKDMRHHWAGLGNFLLDILDYNIPRAALLRGRKIRRMIDTAMAHSTIEECQIPIYVVCTDLITGKEVVLEKGKLGEAIWASGSLPGIFRPVEWGEYLLVDGAVLNKVPARVLQEKGAHIILAVNVTPERDLGMERNREPRSGLIGAVLDRIPFIRRAAGGPNIMRIISRSLSVSGLHQSRIHSDAIDVEIKPRIEHFDFLRFDQFDEIVAAGEEAARKALPEIREAISMKF